MAAYWRQFAHGTTRITALCARPVATAITLAAAIAMAGPARADLKLCNRLSYVIDAALGVEDAGAAATRGWFRFDPGQCRVVLQGAIDAAHLYVHARALTVYGLSPLPQGGHADLCVARADFLIAGAKTCTRTGQHPAHFTEIKPSTTDQGLLANLVEESDYDEAQARLAGLQRLLSIAGYDASPIDGVQGPKTENALSQFLKDHSLPTEAANGANIFSLLVDAAQAPEGAGFAWCNDTRETVMAALGVDENGATVTRGWYRVEPGKCLRPDVKGQPRRLYSYGEAVDADGRVVQRAGKPLAWGGAVVLCTSEAKFEVSEQNDCAANGLASVGFVAVDAAARGGAKVRFGE
jgi:uncharacterized membrane protein